MASPVSVIIIRFRPSSPDVENTEHANETVETNVLLKIPNRVCYKDYYEMRKNENLCDIKIIAKNGKKIRAHKVVLASNSEYFDIMFNSKFKESKELEIKIQDLDPAALSLLIDYIYTSELAVNVQNVQEILKGICLLQLDKTILSECIVYIKSRINPANCLGIKEMAECFGLNDFYTFCLNYALVHFSQVYKNEEFLLITFDQTLQMIKSEDLCANEEKVYKSVMKWIKHDIKNRINHLPDLMEHVRLPIVSREFLECVNREPLLKLHNYNCRKYLDEAYTVHTVFDMELEASHSIRTQYRQNYSEYLVLMGKRTSPILPYLFNVKTNLCRTIPITLPRKRYGESYFLDDGRIFDLGGIEDGSSLFDFFYLKSAHIFDYNTKNWTPIQQMHNIHTNPNIVQIGYRVYVVDEKDSEYYNIEYDKWFKINSLNDNDRADYEVIALDGFIYAVGGYYDCREVNVVEQFDPITNTWRYVAPMLHGRISPTLCALNGCMYAIGGKTFVDFRSLSLVEKYDPSTDSWEEVAKINHAKSHAGAVAVNGKIYVFGGYHGNHTIEVFCPYKNTWSVLSPTAWGIESTINLAGCKAFNVKQHLKSEIFKLIDNIV